MQFTTVAIIAAAAGLAAASPAAVPVFEAYFETHLGGDHACADDTTQETVSYTNTTNVGKCVVIPAHTSSIYVRVPGYASAVNGYAATFYGDRECGTAVVGTGLSNGEGQCLAAPSDADFYAIKVTQQ